MRIPNCLTLRATLLLSGALAVTVPAAVAQSSSSESAADQLAQVALLHELHATFHAAVSVQDPVNGDSPAVINQRIRWVQTIWAENGQLTLINSTATAGNYIGRGDPEDAETCPAPSGDTSATGKQGTLCTFYKYVSATFKSGAKLLSLSPSYLTKFVPVKDANGQWRSSVYFQCHYFDISANATTGQPNWTAKSHVDFAGEARKTDGRWLVTYSSATAVPVPLPPAIVADPEE